LAATGLSIAVFTEFTITTLSPSQAVAARLLCGQAAATVGAL
jgi:hypothetical protein